MKFAITLSYHNYRPGSVAQWIARRTSSWKDLRYSEAVGSSPTGVGEFFAPKNWSQSDISSQDTLKSPLKLDHQQQS